MRRIKSRRAAFCFSVARVREAMAVEQHRLDNLIIRNDAGQPRVAILATKGCGSHRFIAPDLEITRYFWNAGGQIDLVCPYTERAGRFAVNCIRRRR